MEDLSIAVNPHFDGDYLILSTDQVRQALPVIIEKSVPIQRKKTDGSYGFIPPTEFDHYLKEQSMLFYVDRHRYESDIAGQLISGIYTKSTSNGKPVSVETTPDGDDTTYERNLNQVRSMSKNEMIAETVRHNESLQGMVSEGKKFDAHAMAESESIFSDFFCINRVMLEEDPKDDKAHDLIAQLVAGNNTLIDSLLTMIAKGKSTFFDLSRLDSIQTGSSSLNHMIRMLVRFIAFLFFYNGYFQRSSNEVKKWRAYFQTQFLPHYEKVTKGEQKMSLEIVFRNGISPIRERGTFIDYCVGGFLHDLGKMPNIRYHDGAEGFDAAKARRHVFDGYNMLARSKHFSGGVVASGFLHHEYYGASYGYRQNETFRTKFVDRRNRPRDTSSTVNMVSYNVLDVAFGNSHAYFPNKIIEILDVFDAMTDSSKKYRTKNYSTEEAIAEMKRYYINGNELGLDPILFNVFVDFMHASGLIADPGMVETLKV